ncbi:MAG: T9SS type A sorting domain-containing protein [Cytophagaceae bacterium]|nr:T9SS type A sorting domain-containing protein [Cytophagaceae bacterium]
MYDAFGMPVLQQNVNQSQKTISTGNIPTGVYVLKAHLSNGEVVVERLMKQ